jgi:hypothetical protein
MCPKANARRLLIHLPHGYVSYAIWPVFWISLYLAALTDWSVSTPRRKMSGTYLHRGWQGPTMPPGGEGGAAPPGAVCGETLRSRTLGCEVPCSTCRNAETEQFAHRAAVGVGRGVGRSRCWVGTPPRNICQHFQEHKHTSLIPLERESSGVQ